MATNLLISEIFPPKTGGSGRWFWELYSRLPRQSFLIAAGADSRAEAFDHTHDVRVLRLPLTMSAWGLRSVQGLAGYYRAIKRLLPLVKAEQVGQIHCGRCLPEGVMALALKWRTGVPYLCYVHGEDVSTAAVSRELTFLVRRVLGRADYVIANSRSTERRLLDQWQVPAERIRIMHPGVDTQRFVPAPRDQDARDRLGWGRRQVVLTVGRLDKRKGHDQVIRALAAIRKAFPDVLYAIVGDGEQRKALEDMVRESSLGDHVQFLGEASDEQLILCYQQCDLFVLANRQVEHDVEGFGIVLLEAQACGKPVVAGTSGGTAETMRVPQSGRVVPCEGPDQLGAVVVELLRDPALRTQMGLAGREWVVSRFDWSVLKRQAEEWFLGKEPCHLVPGAGDNPGNLPMGHQRLGEPLATSAQPNQMCRFAE
jgi:phosphatidylinositol alpha-1,6-mannosyltransferase